MAANETTPLVASNAQDSKKQAVFTPTEQGRETDKKLDQHLSYEFGGPWGVTAMMIGFPLLMYYLWICLQFYDGRLVYPHRVDDIKPFLHRMWAHVRDDASPTPFAFTTFSIFVLFELFLAYIMPGYKQEGLPVPSLNYKTLTYNCNAIPSFHATLLTVAVLQYTDTFRLTLIMDHFGEFMTAAMIWGFGVSLGTYFITVLRGKQIRMSGNFFYDVFMGAALNPRIGPVDLKMWAEVRIPWILLFLIALAGANKQYDQYGYVSPNAWFMVLATFLYINACCKGEECIPQTWDMFHEKWGFMVIFWNFAGVPFTYCYSILYMATHDPATYRFSTIGYVVLFSTLITAYYIFDTSMSQKSRFRMQMSGTYKERWTFPQLPWGTIHNPKYIQTAHGNKLLVDGWWKFARKINYTADFVMSLCWALVIWNASPIPYFHPVFFITVLIHRTGRDFERCAIKYGRDWDEYCKAVPYKFIPYIY